MRSWRNALLVVSLLALAVAFPRCPAFAEAAAPSALTGAVGETQSGMAAVYSRRLSGHRTASGQRYDPNALTASHQTLPFGTKVKVTNVKNGKSAVLRINFAPHHRSMCSPWLARPETGGAKASEGG